MVPTIQGRIPPLVMESVGGWVRKVQLMALQPLLTRKYRMITRARPLMSAAILKNPNMSLWNNLRLPLLPGFGRFLLAPTRSEECPSDMGMGIIVVLLFNALSCKFPHSPGI
jgi:hypothetical protein